MLVFDEMLRLLQILMDSNKSSPLFHKHELHPSILSAPQPKVKQDLSKTLEFQFDEGLGAGLINFPNGTGANNCSDVGMIECESQPSTPDVDIIGIVV